MIIRISGAGAAGLAAVLQGLLPELKGKKYDMTRSNLNTNQHA